MAVITIKVDESLKDQSAAVLEELGLDLPTAIRMYLKSVVRENGLPISTKLPAPLCAACVKAPAAEEAPAEEAPAEEAPAVLLDAEAEQALEEDDLIDDVAAGEAPAGEAPAEEAPAEEPAVVIDYETRAGRKAVAALFMDAILSVPAGQLTRWSDMEEALTARFGTEVKRPASVRWPAVNQDGVEIPYWRIVGERGAVRGDKMIEQAVQEEKLKNEGHEFIPAGHGIFSGIKVDGYKDKLFQW